MVCSASDRFGYEMEHAIKGKDARVTSERKGIEEKDTTVLEANPVWFFVCCQGIHMW